MLSCIRGSNWSYSSLEKKKQQSKPKKEVIYCIKVDMKFIGFYNICELLSFTCRFFVFFFFCKSWALLKFVFLNDFGVLMLMISMRVLRKTWNWKKKLMKIITSKFKKSYIVSNIVNNFTCKQEIRGKFLCNGRWW
jgi:hypothetical protein